MKTEDLKIIEDLLAQLDDDSGTIMGDKAVYTTEEDRAVLIDALVFYKEMNII